MERLDKALSGTGRWSRREVKELVRRGRVLLDDCYNANPVSMACLLYTSPSPRD